MNWSGKKIAILGLGIENVALVKYLVGKKAQVTVCDHKSEEDLTERINQLEGFEVDYRFGQDYLENLEEFSVVFRSPGLPLFLPQLQLAQKKGTVISSAIKFFMEVCPAQIIGVTGTKGKGTTSTLIGQILSQSGIVNYVMGNIGRAPFDLIGKIKKDDWVILELSSFQLEDFDRSPHIAIVLNLYPDHLAPLSEDNPNYHRSFQQYLNAKRNIVRYQKNSDFAVINLDFLELFTFAEITLAKVLWFSKKISVDQGAFVERRIGDDIIILRVQGEDKEIIKIKDIPLIGEHNLENVCAASIASFLAGATVPAIRKGISQFKGLPHRLEFVGGKNGVKFYNDSYATAPSTAISAILSFAESMVWIGGGSTKGADFKELGKIIAGSTIHTAILIGQEAFKIEQAIKKAGGKQKIISSLTKMKDIVAKAFKLASPQDVVLLSPGCASFDLFKNASDRGDQFRNEVSLLKEKILS